MYDEFGNLKKKYRVKTNQADARPAVAAGRAGWEVEELGNFFSTSTHRTTLCKQSATTLFSKD